MLFSPVLKRPKQPVLYPLQRSLHSCSPSLLLLLTPDPELSGAGVRLAPLPALSALRPGTNGANGPQWVPMGSGPLVPDDVLDEIDAALDFKNVSIVAHYIKVPPPENRCVFFICFITMNIGALVALMKRYHL